MSMVLGTMVLCVLAVVYIGITHALGTPIKNVAETPCPRNAKPIVPTKLPRKCGVIGSEESVFRLTSVVFGGSNSSTGRYPWMAALGYRSEFSTSYFITDCSIEWDWLCGGTLVTKRHIITAAHCLEGDKGLRLKVVRLGGLNLNDSVEDGASPVDYEVDKWTQHPDFNPENLANDIAVVQLKRSVTFTSNIKPICLPTQDKFRTRNFTGHSAYIAGCGAGVYKGKGITHQQEAVIEIFNNTVCKEAYSKVMPQHATVLDNRLICAAGNGTDTCQGDSSGPLMVRYGPRSKFYLYGVVSYGYGCGEKEYPGLYTRVTEFMNWILSILTARCREKETLNDIYPWMAALGYRCGYRYFEPCKAEEQSLSASDKVKWVCTGTLVTDRHVITGADCLHFANIGDYLKVVRLGDMNLNDSVQDGASPVDYNVDEWIVQPDYYFDNIPKNVGIVRLKEKVTFTRNIQPIRLPIQDDFRTKNFIGYSVYVAGWGTRIFVHCGKHIVVPRFGTVPRNIFRSPTLIGVPRLTPLQQAVGKIINNSVCIETYRARSFSPVIDNRVICSRRNSTEGCEGDSGGPVMVKYGPHSDFYLYGIQTIVYGCQTGTLFETYTRVTEFMPWMLSNMK